MIKIKARRLLQLIIFSSFFIATCQMAWSWEFCHSDTDYDQDVDGGDIYQVSRDFISQANSEALGHLAKELGRCGCGASPITITSPSDGEIINARWIMVEGTIVLPSDGEAGITINGAPAMTFNDRFVLNQLPLSQGNNIVTVRAANVTGETITRSISVNAAWPEHYVRLDADVDSGLSPFVSKLYVNTDFDFSSAAVITPSGPGPVTFLENDKDRFKIEMTTPGVYYLTASAPGPQSTTYSDTLCMIAMDETALDTLLRAKWQKMLGSLSAGDTGTAAACIASGVRGTYQYNFDLLSSHLGAFADSFHDMQLIRIAGSKAEYNVQGNQSGTMYSFYVVFIKDNDGIWRISFF
ncbi:MAG: hypothetical protein JEZ12_13645 [Desulfobacterium sp.]|nr:hypothetical protein [Desulfobacterium sp.]